MTLRKTMEMTTSARRDRVSLGGGGAGAYTFFFVFSGVGIVSLIVYFYCFVKPKRAVEEAERASRANANA